MNISIYIKLNTVHTDASNPLPHRLFYPMFLPNLKISALTVRNLTPPFVIYFLVHFQHIQSVYRIVNLYPVINTLWNRVQYLCMVFLFLLLYFYFTFLGFLTLVFQTPLIFQLLRSATTAPSPSNTPWSEIDPLCIL